MRILVISDIHANFTALETVLSDAGDFDTVWCLGDVVGYGPDPNQCIEVVRQLPNLVCLLGNHDAAVIGDLDVSTFNPEARVSIEWQKEEINSDGYDFLNNLPRQLVAEDVTLVLGSPRSPVFEYLLNTYLATVNFHYFSTDYCFVGHTHLPLQFHQGEQDKHAQLFYLQEHFPTELAVRSIINPGSVGQPRDGDPRASYAIFCSEEKTWEYRRVPYDIVAVQSRMRKAKLPEPHVERLALGW